ncbi:ABC transporter substrate-binding protein [Leucobacter sp. OH1287]|uniref:ABC transporter substrate-binding protein n=1 Tax=Leucobacter sp. OH1287 TaxID=2491049 RepID=UPI000F602B3E|nr:ABC transporter substrate-binding protein [Leucobacter sp. OH1287]RRD60380.1 extracellular solute-binding protein [Leucobacter sp. OH1287]
MKLTRSLGLAIVAGLTALSIAGCSTSDNAAQSADSASGTGETKSSELTLYTSEPQEKIDALLEEFHTLHPEVKVTVFRAGTGDLTARIAAEQKTGEIGADLLLAADAATFERYAAEDLLLAYESPESKEILPELVDPEHMYVGTRLIPTVIAVNTDAINDAPKSWQDLTDPKYENLIAMPNPDVSGAAAYNAAVWLNESELGEDWLTELAANKPLIAESNGPVSQAVANGSNPVGIVVDSLVRDLAAAGSPIKAVYPEEGVPYITQPVGIFAHTKEPDAAKLLVDFLLSKAGQEIAVSQSYLPIRTDVDSPAGAPKLEDLKLFSPDLKRIQDTQADAVKLFNELFQ